MILWLILDGTEIDVLWIRIIMASLGRIVKEFSLISCVELIRLSCGPNICSAFVNSVRSHGNVLSCLSYLLLELEFSPEYILLTLSRDDPFSGNYCREK